MNNRIIVLKLITGDEVITEMGDEVEGAFTLIHPGLLQRVSRDERGSSLVMVPWITSSGSASCLLSKTAAIGMSVPTEDFREFYADFVQTLTGAAREASAPDNRQEMSVPSTIEPTKELVEAAKKIAAGQLLYVSPSSDKLN